jgi:hypothetical protein
LIHYFATNTQESRLASGGNTGLAPNNVRYGDD